MLTGHLIQRGHLYTCSSHSVCHPALRALILLGADSPSCAPCRPPAAPRGSWARARTGAGSGSGHGAGPGLRHSALGAHLGFQGFTDRKWGEAHQHLDPGPPPPSPQYSSIFPENPTPENPTPQDPLSFTTRSHSWDLSSGTPSSFSWSSTCRSPGPLSQYFLFLTSFSSAPRPSLGPSV